MQEGKYLPNFITIMYITKWNLISRQLISVLAGIFLFASMGLAESFTLKKVTDENIPQIRKHRLSYNVDFQFNKCPENYWVYYDQPIKKLVLDFYDVTLEGPETEFTGNSLFKELEIKNLTSVMALSGERSQIIFPLDSGWHIQSSQPDEKTLRITLWKDLGNSLVDKKKKRPFLPWIIAAGAVVVVAVLGGVYYELRH